MTQIYDRHLAPFELTIAQFGLLVQLRAASGASVGELAERMIMDATTLSRNIRPLERRGLLAAEADKADGRVRKLKLTSSGRALVERASAGWRAAQKQVEQALGGPEHMRVLNEALDGALEKLAV